jgi:hypothetical protein
LLLHGTLKIVYQIYHSKQEKQKRKSKFFNRDNFVLPWWILDIILWGLSPNLYPPYIQGSTGILFWYKQTVMTTKKVIAARNLQDCLPNLPLKC